MARSFRLPDLGEGVHEGEVLAVHVSEGDDVKEGDILLEVETDKAAVEIPSPFSGKVSAVRVAPGDTVRVGDVLVVFDGEGDGEADADVTESAEPDGGPEADGGSTEKSKGQPVPASPATRRLARELGVDLGRIQPTGRGGVVTAEDVKSFASGQTEKTPEPEISPPVSERAKDDAVAGKETPDLPDFSQWGEIERVPLRSIRKATAKQMATAWSQIPHVSSQDVVDVSLLESFRQKHKAEIEEAGGHLTMTVFALKAAATALKAFPHFNASLDMATEQIVIKRYYHIGIAVDTDDGLIVPVIRDVDRKSIRELAVELAECIRRTRKRKVSREELLGGTFTITNAGAIGGGLFTPIINHPQVAILGMGQARMQPSVMTTDDGSHHVEPRLMLPVVLCFDHRIVDGADAIGFLQLVCNALQDPDELLMTMT